MSHTNDATLDDEPGISVEVIATKGPSSIRVWSQPAFWTGKAQYQGSVEFKFAGNHGASFQLPWLTERLIASEIRDSPTTTYKKSSVNRVPSTSVLKGDQSCPPQIIHNTPTKGCTETRSGRITPCSTNVPQSSLTVPESPPKATAADSAVGPPIREDVVILAATSLLPTAADPIESPSRSLPRSGQKRGRQDGDEDGRPSKRGRVLGFQDDTRCQGV